MPTPNENIEPEIKVRKDKKPKQENDSHITELAKKAIPLYGDDSEKSLSKKSKTDTITEEAIAPETPKLIPESPKITAFLEIFEEKLKKTIQKINIELDKKKNGKNCDRNLLKKMIKEAKTLKKNVKKVRDSKILENGVTATSEFMCPHCGGTINI